MEEGLKGLNNLISLNGFHMLAIWLFQMALKVNITVYYRSAIHEKLKALLVFIAFQFLMFYYCGNLLQLILK